MRVATLKKRKTNSLRRKPKHKTPKGIVHRIIFIIPLVNDKTRASLSSSFSYLDISYRGPPGKYKARSIDFKVGGEGSSNKIFTIKKKGNSQITTSLTPTQTICHRGLRNNQCCIYCHASLRLELYLIKRHCSRHYWNREL